MVQRIFQAVSITLAIHNRRSSLFAHYQPDYNIFTFMCSTTSLSPEHIMLILLSIILLNLASITYLLFLKIYLLFPPFVAFIDGPRTFIILKNVLCIICIVYYSTIIQILENKMINLFM